MVNLNLKPSLRWEYFKLIYRLYSWGVSNISLTWSMLASKILTTVVTLSLGGQLDKVIVKLLAKTRTEMVKLYSCRRVP